MARPKKGTKEGDLATKRWRETMEKRYGGPEGAHRLMQRLGQMGGRNGHTGGFAANRELAVRAGRKGGSKSRRGPANNTDKYRPIILQMMSDGTPISEISRITGIEYNVARKVANELRLELSEE